MVGHGKRNGRSMDKMKIPALIFIGGTKKVNVRSLVLQSCVI